MAKLNKLDLNQLYSAIQATVCKTCGPSKILSAWHPCMHSYLSEGTESFLRIIKHMQYVLPWCSDTVTEALMLTDVWLIYLHINMMQTMGKAKLL